MAGLLIGYHRIARAGKFSPLTTHSPAHAAVILERGTTKYETSCAVSCAKRATILAQSHSFFPSMVNAFAQQGRTRPMMPVLTSRQMAFGTAAVMSVHFFDVRVFYFHAQSYCSLQIPVVYRNHERQKRSEYEERIREVDKGSFTPLVFSSSGGAGPAATTMLKRLADIYANRMAISYNEAIAWLRCRLAFALLRSSVLCLRGARAPKGRIDYDGQLQPDLARGKGHVR